MSWYVMSTAAVRSTTRRRARVHPLPVRIMHWINAIAIFIMIGSGWKIYNDDIIFSFLRFPESILIGKWAQYGLQWHFLHVANAIDLEVGGEMGCGNGLPTRSRLFF